jgi:hypothetical protein
MQHTMTERRPTRAAPLLALGVGGLFAAGLLSACSSAGENPFTVFADPGRYAYLNCEQIAGQQSSWRTRQEELKLLMDKAGRSAGGAVVNVIAYQSDYVNAGEELKVLEATARSKNCGPPK